MKPIRYELRERRALADLARELAALLGCAREHAGRFQRVYLDTFDWRLYADGLVCEAEQAADGVRLRVMRSGSQDALITQQRVDLPRFAGDLPDSPMGRRMAALIEMRALMPRARLSGREERLALRDAEGKTLLRVTLSEESVRRDSGRAAGRRRTVVALRPVRGYPAQAARARKQLDGLAILRVLRGDPFEQAMEALGRKPLDYSTKLRFAIDPRMRADVAVRQMLMHLLDTMELNEPGVREDLDSEFLHDFRVAVRRTRAMLGQMKGVLPAGRAARFREDFAWLGQLTGPLRDLHVYHLTVPDYQAALPAGARGDLEPFRGFLERHARAEHAVLVEALDSARYRRLKTAWRRVLAAPPARRPAAPHAAVPIVALAGARIWKAHRRVLREGRAIEADTPPEALHELRKSCKKLRYLLEFFAGLFGRDAVPPLVKALKGLQENLGTYQDLHVQQTSLAAFSRAMHDEDHVPEATTVAMEMLIEELARREREVRREFERRFARFDTVETRRRFKALRDAGRATAAGAA